MNKKIFSFIFLLFLSSSEVLSLEIEKYSFSDNEVVSASNIQIEKFADKNTLPYDFSDVESIPIRLSILEEITTKGGILEGSRVNFQVKENVYHNNKIIIRKGDIVSARVETYVTRGLNGFPAELIIDNFEIEGIKKSQLLSTYTKTGTNRCLWVYPLKWALTPIPFAGSLTNFILGGEAKIKPKDVITIYYYPNWK